MTLLDVLLDIGYIPSLLEHARVARTAVLRHARNVGD